MSILITNNLRLISISRFFVAFFILMLYRNNLKCTMKNVIERKILEQSSNHLTESFRKLFTYKKVSKNFKFAFLIFKFSSYLRCKGL